ncbi:Bifunctional protein PutA [Pirellulimonas nuda]|uniref:L-glutamate gamma-semialdehyde dehydrogenase n=1 Tax=Pirellulimonas nuda TaxID=2528009 RepID=A0A518DI56_9BACT|nr:bifunctional proline dehydrogenase/L-glutamate gamma-semialdehyde dehydrogenase [Pirellulimonas nuda]QDU91168.1 Bifunctional protein PutA [Pirellulimonas nuda]
MTKATREQLESVLSNHGGGDPIAAALHIARRLQQRAAELQTPPERRQQAELDRMMQSPGDKATLVELTDQAFRSKQPPRAADQMIHLLDVQGVPRFFSPVERGLLAGFQTFGAYLPGVAMPLVKEHMQQETANVVLPAEREHLKKHLDARRAEGVRMNVNHLGEALLGEDEAERQLRGYLQTLQRPEIEVISVKISTLYSQISPLARRHTVAVLADRLELLFRAAAKGRFTRADGSVVPKFVYLDMEEYRDLRLTAEAFMTTLDRPGLDAVAAGVALQAYAPDSFGVQQQINAWARERVARGGAAVTIRIVKGANMEMERVEASLRGWPQAPYRTKPETDANYLRMLHEGLRPENIAAVRLGVASHNLFTLAYALVAAHRAGALDRVQFEMLEGMANHQRRALFELDPNLLLYAPACSQDEFLHAICYLVRRLDENTGPDNFLRHAFNIKPGSEDWRRLEQQFVDSVGMIGSVSDRPRRTQDRHTPPQHIDDGPFANEPDTDFALPHNGAWAEAIVRRWAPLHGAAAADVALVVAGDVIDSDRDLRESRDPSRPGVVVSRYRQATADDIERAVACAAADPSGWRRRSPAERSATLERVARELAAARGDLIGVMLAEAGKTVLEGDPEVSEAIDFCRYYGRCAVDWAQTPGLCAGPGGVSVVVSPWNFPLAIPCGGVAAALAAGNTVILKPASYSVYTAYLMCECFWRAGVPHAALQFAPCPGADVGERLVTHAGVDHVILTGGTDTARRMLAARPTTRLFAETGGKNATIVTALADRELAISHVIQSAFGHAGQKCSATSLLILEDEVYHDAAFRELLRDAVESLRVGSAWELETRMGPLIAPPAGDLERALKELEPGESWGVRPWLALEENPCLVSPGVKWDVSPGSVTHRTEFFGPLLGVMRARDLHEAVALVNATGYGLTSGLASLDDREQSEWRAEVRAGNLYINRPTTGAIVQRQPFGGMGLSAVGPGIKAGGPNYVAPLMALVPAPSPEATRLGAEGPGPSAPLLELLDSLRAAGEVSEAEATDLTAALADYECWAQTEYLETHDDQRLIGQDNLRRYLPLPVLRVRVDPDDSAVELLARIAAGRTLDCRVVVSYPADLAGDLMRLVQQVDEATDAWGAAIEFVEESDRELAAVIAAGESGRVRYASPSRVPIAVQDAAAQSLAFIADAPVTLCGRLDLLWCVQEQSVSFDYHRYGNLGRRAGEDRAAVL